MQAQPVEEPEQPQSEDRRRSPPPDEEERGTAPDPITKSEPEPGVEEAQEDASARRRVAPRVVTNFSEGEKELVIDFLQKTCWIQGNSSKRPTVGGAGQTNDPYTQRAQDLYENMRTKRGKLKKAVTKSGQAADRFTTTEQCLFCIFQRVY